MYQTYTTWISNHLQDDIQWDGYWKGLSVRSWAALMSYLHLYFSNFLVSEVEHLRQFLPENNYFLNPPIWYLKKPIFLASGSPTVFFFFCFFQNTNWYHTKQSSGKASLTSLSLLLLITTLRQGFCKCSLYVTVFISGCIPTWSIICACIIISFVPFPWSVSLIMFWGWRLQMTEW